MSIFQLATLVLLASLLAGCLTSSEQIAQRNEERCAARGLKPNSDAYSDCIAALESQRERRMDTRRQEMLERSNAPAAMTRN